MDLILTTQTHQSASTHIHQVMTEELTGCHMTTRNNQSHVFIHWMHSQDLVQDSNVFLKDTLRTVTRLLPQTYTQFLSV